MKKLTITTASEINAKGNLSSGHCKPVVCIDTGEVFTSIRDAVDAYGGNSYTNMWQHLCGKRKVFKGKHFCYLSNATQNLNALTERIRQLVKLEEKAAKWDALMAEQEAVRKAEEKRIEEERKAEEKRLADLAKAKAKQQRQQEMYERAMAKASELLAAMAATKSEINNLEGKEEVA